MPPICGMPEPLLWLRADAGFSAGTWLDQTSNLRHGTNTGAPALINDVLNFNPAVRYNGASQTFSNIPELNWLSGTHHVTIFAVYVPANNNTNMGLFGNQGNGGSNNIMMFNGIIGDGAGPAPDYPVPGLYGARPHLLSYVVDEENAVAGTANASSASNRGTLQVAYTYDENNLSQMIPNMHVGRSGTNGSSQYFTGDIAEFIIFERSNGSLSLNTSERLRMQSYLAMKYGLTLAHDYFFADNTLIWNTVTNSGYNNRITSIGRDDCYPFEQRKSLSVESGGLVTITHTASGGSFAAPSAFPVDKRAILFGDDNGTLTLGDNIGPRPNRKLNRDWKVIEYGAVGNVTISVPKASLPSSLSHFMVYSDPSNPHIGAQYLPLVDAGTTWTVELDLVSGRYFSLVDLDNDRDGIDDVTDLDDDNDGIPDTVEGCGNLIMNGSFEADDFTNTALYPGGFTGPNGTFMGVTYNSNTMTAWQYTLNCDGWREGGTWANAYDGGQYLDLIGNTNVTGGVPNVLYQDMPTIPGQVYDLTVHWGEDVGHNAGEVVTLNARILDASANIIFDTTMTRIAMGPVAGVQGPNTWFLLQRGFTATTSSTRLELKAIPPVSNSGAGAVVDAISVVTRNSSCTDSDSDGISDSHDLDSDNDGIYDCVESGSGQAFTAGVLNGAVTANGIPVSVDANANNVVDYTIRDSDADGNIDSLELDSDNDGCPDVIEAGYTDANSDGLLGPAPLTVDANGLVTSGNN